MLGTEYGAEKNQWLVNVSLVSLGVFFLLVLVVVAVVLRGLLLRFVGLALRPIWPIFRSIRIFLMISPARKYQPFRRYLYVGRHMLLEGGKT